MESKVGGWRSRVYPDRWSMLTMGSQHWEWSRGYWSYCVHRTWDIDDSRSLMRLPKWSLKGDCCSCHFGAVDIDSQGIVADGESSPPAPWSVLP